MADILSNLWANWKFNDVSDTVATEEGGLYPLAITQNSGLFPKRRVINAPGDMEAILDVSRFVRLFSRVDVTASGSAATNYAMRTGISAGAFTAVMGGPNTVAFWYKRDAHPDVIANAERAYCFAGDGSGSAAGVDIATANRLSMTHVTNKFNQVWSLVTSGNASTTFAYTIPAGVWIHVALVMAPAAPGFVTTSLYINGALQETSGSLAQPWHWTVPPTAGGVAVSRAFPSAISGPTSGGQIGGYMKDLRAYARALAAADVAALAYYPKDVADWTAIEDVIQAQIAAGSGLAGDHVIWGFQNRDRTGRDRIMLEMSGDAGTSPALPENTVGVNPNSTGSDGSEIIVTNREEHTFTVLVHYYSGTAAGSNSARSKLNILRGYLNRLDVTDALGDKGIALVEGGAITAIPLVLETEFESRAVLPLTFRVVDGNTQTTTYIETAEFSGVYV